MKKAIAVAVAALFILVFVPALASTNAQSLPQIDVYSKYSINPFGFAIISENFTLTNNGTAPIQTPSVELGFTQNVTTAISAQSVKVTGAGYTESQSAVGNQTVYVIGDGGASLAAGSTSKFSFQAYTVSIAEQKNGSDVLIMTRPFFNLPVTLIKSVIQMPSTAQFGTIPTGFVLNQSTNVTYTYSLKNQKSLAAASQISAISKTSATSYYPIDVVAATRTISEGPNGLPMVQDYVKLKNFGSTEINALPISPLENLTGSVTVLPVAQPPLLSAVKVGLSGGAIDIANTTVGLPVDPGANLSLTYTYPLGSQYYTTSGGVVTVNVPLSPPVPTYVGVYTIDLALSPGAKGILTAPDTLTNVAPFQTGTYKLSYGLSLGWALDSGVPVASVLFIVAFLSLFALGTRTTEEETEEFEESATERTSAMIKAFEEKTSLINSMFDEISNADPSQMNKAYFDEIRGRLDTFRSRALQRLNEVKQKSTTTRFFELLNEMHKTEREVDRAAKDRLNLYEQFYTKRMRKEVFDKLLPSYKSRLDKALNQLSDELNTAQKEAKLV